MGSRKQPIRTYQRKTVKSLQLLSLPMHLTETYISVENVRKQLDKDTSSNNSLNYDPFETTFDRIAKGAVVPPLPPNAYENDSWNGSSSDSDISNAINIKSPGADKFTAFQKNDAFSSTYNDKLARKCKMPQQYELNELTSATSKKTSKKTRTMSTKLQTSLKNKLQDQKKQRHKVRKRKQVTQSNSKKSNSIKQQRYSKSNIVNSINDVSHENVLRNININHTKSLETDKMALLQTTLDNLATSFKFMSSPFSDIKPCFVTLEDCATVAPIQNWRVPDSERITTDKAVSHDTKLQSTDESFEKIHDSISKPISIEYTDIIKSFKSISLKPCSVILHNNIVENYNREHINNSDAHDTSIVPKSVLHSSSEVHYNSNTKSAIHDTKPNAENLQLIKDSFVKVERLKIEHLVKRYKVTLGEEKQDMVSSTPLGKRVRPSMYPVLLSPIDTGNTSRREEDCSMAKETVALSYEYPKKKLRLSIIQLKDHRSDNVDIEDIEKQQTQILVSSQEMNEFFKVEKISPEENLQTALTQKCNIDVELPHSLNMSAVTDQSRSLFGDTTTHSYNYPMRDVAENETWEKFDEAALQNADSIIHARQEQSDKARGNVVLLGDFKEEFEDKIVIDSVYSLPDSQDINIVNADVSFIQLQNSSRITTRKKLRKQQHLDMSVISKSSNCENMQSNDEIFHYVPSNEDSNIHQQSDMNNFEYSDNASRQIQKSVFLKPGKSWIRSLSILSNINDETNINQLSLGKGRKWRNSVRDLLDMQKQGVFGSCLKEQNDATDLADAGPDVSNASSLDTNKHKTFTLTNHNRLSKRISVRVVLNDTSAKHDVKDIPFLEAFGISIEHPSNLKSSHRTYLARRNKHSITARDIVLEKCSQQCYLSFSECFPNSYLEHCRKIGEGVYGEVFLHEYNNTKSVIKIIPIEGNQLVNGEPQKKFNEILSEIVIAKELDNLRLNSTHRTTGFVQVNSIKCIIGKYPEKLVELWNIYDEQKTSDNDCPSMFDANQLYIALELNHGGEDLEAFIFQTAEEAYALFLQIALALAVAEKALEFEHRDLHWGNVLIAKTKDKYVYYNLDEKEIRLPTNGVKVSIIDFTLSRMLYQDCCIYNDLALDPALFTAHGEYQFEIYRLMRDKIQNNWQKFEPYTNILWLHYILDKMITMVRYKRKNWKVHRQTIARLKDLKNVILNYDSVYDFVSESNNVACL